MTDADPRSSGLSHLLKRLWSRLTGRTDEKEELLEQLREAEAHDVIDADAVSMMEGVLQVSDLAVRDLMVPRAQMDVIDIEQPLQEILEFVIQTAHSRFPVFENKRDNIIGVLLAKDILKVMADESQDIRGLLRPAVFVPESKRLNIMLRDFRLNRNHIAMVVDEYGGVSGLITIEDVLEQIVGDIEDEHDIEEEDDNILPVPHLEGQFRIRALTPLEQFNAHFESSLSDESADTIGGFVTDRLGRVPHKEEVVELEGFVFEIQRADARMVHMLLVQRAEVAVEDADNALTGPELGR
ncbi:MAG: CBS domain-containing protein [Betaproteobacteria bacterium]|jgi:magnesium and cobalt transporter|nr:CBS domain-containing protein [Betaproteobacteria bacterium]